MTDSRSPMSTLRVLVRGAALAAALSVSACGGDKATGEPTKVTPETPTKTEGDPIKGAAADGAAAASAAGDAAAEGTPDGGKADAAEAGTAGGGDAKAADGGDAKAADGGDAKAAGETGAPPADPKALLKEVRKKRTKDERALEALAQAEAAGATPKDLAKAANARGEALHSKPDRAKKFFEWAAAKDPKAATPVFNLAKQAVMVGDLTIAKEHLAEVKKRKGKKLLQQVEFDPTFEVIKDDPDVRELLH